MAAEGSATGLSRPGIDKESWWFGFELVETPYSFEEHYGSILGHKKGNENRVCSFTIAHLDDRTCSSAVPQVKAPRYRDHKQPPAYAPT
jgi:hypothetical protein